MLSAVPIYAVLVEDVGERGAHLVAFQEYQRIRGEDLALIDTTTATTTPAGASTAAGGRDCCGHSHWCSMFTNRSFTTSVGVTLAFLLLSKIIRKSA